MITCRLYGSNWTRFFSWMSAWMKSSSADPDLVRNRREEAVALGDGLQRVPDQRIGLP